VQRSLKKNGTPAARHWSRSACTQARSTGRWPGPDSPPAMTHSSPPASHRRRSRRPSNGSQLANRPTAGVWVSLASRTVAQRWSSTLVPSHTFGSGVRSSSKNGQPASGRRASWIHRTTNDAIRPGRLVNTW
jgi:hypothetical protein